MMIVHELVVADVSIIYKIFIYLFFFNFSAFVRHVSCLFFYIEGLIYVDSICFESTFRKNFFRFTLFTNFNNFTIYIDIQRVTEFKDVLLTVIILLKLK